ncbi:MAG: RDD family protein [Candidatus Izimaplasma sp.]|nr:RDD family protein [Candidatus Izimaplasma bacterium]
MRVGFFRRIAAFLLDAMPIILILSLLLSLFVGDLLKSSYPNYDHKVAIYQENMDEYYETLNIYKTRLDLEELTTEEYEEMSANLQADFTNNNEYFISIIFAYYVNVAVYFFISFTSISYVYHLYFKGQTVGRKLMKIELFGNINWYTILLREVLWKSVFWLFTFSAGIAIDMTLIAFTSKKKTIRDYLSQTELRHSGTSYPF